jgi:hypothetical protein
VKISKAHNPIGTAGLKSRQSPGEKWISFLEKADAAKTVEQKKRWGRQAMRAFYGDNRGDEYA